MYIIYMENENIDTETNPNTVSPTTSDGIALELGDIIELVSPSNNVLHESSFFIQYIDSARIMLVNITTMQEHQINIGPEGQLTDESIIQIHLLNRSEERGYARQNALLPNTWINIHIGGDIPTIITGEITNLEEDMIEIVTFPELRTIFIDFKYQGIPDELPIEKIVIREKPASVKNVGSLSAVKQVSEGDEEPIEEVEKASIEFTENGESVIRVDEDAEEPEIRDTLHELYADSNAILFGEQLDEVVQYVELPEHEQRYSIESQVNDMMDELLSVIPNQNRTRDVLDGIHLIVERYKYLREHFSKFDANQNIYDIKKNGPYYKPLVERIKNMDTKLQWLVPVVNSRRKLYNIMDLDGNPVAYSDKDVIKIEQAQSKQSSFDYDATHKTIDKLMSSYDEPNNTDNCLTVQSVRTNIDTIIGNLDNFYSAVYTEGEVLTKQYVIQRYNLGQSRMHGVLLKSGKKIFVRKDITQEEKMCIQSFLMLPYSVIRHSSMYLPSTDILTKSTFHEKKFMLSQLFNKYTDIVPHMINDISNELDYDGIEAESKLRIMDSIHEFVLDKETYMDNAERYDQFLDTIIPKTRVFIRMFRKYLTNKMSFTGVVQQLEPFMIYPSDISYKQYMEIRFFIKEQIGLYKAANESRFRELNALASNNTVNIDTNQVLRTLKDNQDLYNTLFNAYRVLKTNGKELTPSSSEVLLQLLQCDNAELYSSVITSLMLPLMTPSNILTVLEAPAIDEMSDVEKMRSKDCVRLFLAKKYTSLAALQKDNNVDDVIVDEDHDNTPYDILDKYKKEKGSMAPDLFLDFLKENLMEKHDVSFENAEDLAKTLIMGKRMVDHGHYAALVLDTRAESSDTEIVSPEDNKRVTYYKRVKNIWVKDEDVDVDGFVDSASLFCNISKECSYNVRSKMCDSVPGSQIRMKNDYKKQLLNEFDKRYDVSIEELEKELEARITQILKTVKKNNILTDIITQKPNNIAFEMGKYASKNDSIESPNTKLRDLILGQNEFTKKQRDICMFTDKFCREPMIDVRDEDQHWLYCKDTNAKLLPRFLYELAETFVTGNNYVAKQQELCVSIGQISDDGDAIVDKHSGYIIRKIDYSAEEGFDESGFRVVTNDIMEADLGTTLLAAATKKQPKKRVFDSDQSEMIFNISNTLCRHIDIPIEQIEEFIIRTSNELIQKNVLSESAYKRRSDAAVKKTGKPLGSYMKYKNETIIIIITAVFFIAIQTTIPSFKTTRTFPGCVRSLTGYPMDGVEDLTGIQYMACILYKSKSSITPWDSIQKINAEKLGKRILDVLQKYIMIRPDMEELYTRKRQYLVLTPDSIIPAEHRVQKWLHYLPPLVKYSVASGLKPLSSDFKTNLMGMFKRGDIRQYDGILTLKSKMDAHGFAMVELINKLVNNQDTLMKTSGMVPFVENACCNENPGLTNPIIYFNELDNTIKNLLQRSHSMQTLHTQIRNITGAPFLFHKEKTGMQYPDIPVGHLEENIYAAIIHYCNFDKKLPIPDILKEICNEKPELYNTKWSILEKMEFLKKNGKQYGLSNLYKLMSIVNRRNIINTTFEPEYRRVAILSDIVDHLERTNSDILSEPFRKHLRGVLNTYKPDSYTEVHSEEQDRLFNYLDRANHALHDEILSFMDEYGNMNNTEYNELHDNLRSLTKWKLDETDGIYDNGIYTVAQNIHTIVSNLAKIYPTMLTNGLPNLHIKLHIKRNNFSDFHKKDLDYALKKYYKQLQLAENDNILHGLLGSVCTSLKDVLILLENIPVHTEIRKEIVNEKGEPETIMFHLLFSKRTTYHLLQHCVYSVIHQYVVATNDPELLRIDVQTRKEDRREEIRSIENDADQIQSAIESADNDFDEIDIRAGDERELKTRVAELLRNLITMQIDDKETVDITYAEIKKKVGRAKEREKRGIIEYLGEMSIEERQVENSFKKFRLGRWNVGRQKGLVSYDPSTYNRERKEAHGSQSADPVTWDLDDLEKDNAAEQEREELEETDIQGLSANYNDGDYYGDDDPEDYED